MTFCHRSTSHAATLCFSLLVLFGALPLAATADEDANLPQSATSPATVPTLRCGTLSGKLRLDGVLDEPAWAAAEAIENLTMIDPTEGAEPSFPTEIRVLADDKRIVIGVVCHDREPAKIVSWSVARDSGLGDEDHVKIVIDTYGDGRTGYIFAVNPLGARYDALVSNRGESENRNWDGLWEAKAIRTGTGWSAEISIPIATLSFREGLHTWGFNVRRRVQRLLETDRWATPRRDFKVTHVRHAGRITGLPDFDLGLGLSLRPALVSGFVQPSRDEDHDFDSELSLDVTQKLSPNLVALLTVNTDFAETDVDSFRTNLTRFPLFFPEKRSFFLEGNEVFGFGLGINHDAMPFHSRRIGLVDGEEVPLRYGAKVFGQMGDTNLGVLGVNMGEESGVSEESNMGVVRLSQNIFDESTIGFIATRGDPVGRKGAWTFGGDFTYQTSEFLGDKNFLAGFWGIAMDRDDIDGDRRSAAGFKIDYPNDLLDMAVIYKRVGEDFDPSLGFVPRTGINKYVAKAEFMPYSEIDWIRQHFFEFYASYVTSIGGAWESYRMFTAPINCFLESGDSFEFNVIPEGENLPEDFEISDGITVDEEDYHWTRYRVKAEAASKRVLSGEASWEFGRFYDGHLDTYEAELEWNPVPLLTLFVTGEKNVARLGAGSFTEDVYGTRVRFNFSPDLTLSSFVQYDTEDDRVGTNTRLQWSVTPESNLYFVVNYNVSKLDEHWRRESYLTRVKVEYTFRF
jgi:hypothetical protein